MIRARKPPAGCSNSASLRQRVKDRITVNPIDKWCWPPWRPNRGLHSHINKHFSGTLPFKLQPTSYLI